MTPLVMALKYRNGDSNVRFGSQELELDTGEIWWRWQELLYTDKVVTVDSVAPAGIYTDPTSNRDYLLFRYRLYNSMLGIDVTDADPIIGPGALDGLMPTHTFIDESQYSMASGTIQLVSGPVVAAEVLKDPDWNFTPATDELTRVNWTTGSETAYEFTLDTSGDPDGYIYELLLEVYNRGSADSAPSDTTNYGRQNNQFRVRCALNAGTSRFEVLGGNYRATGEPASPYEEIKAYVIRNFVTGQLHISFYIQYVYGSSPKSLGVRNIRLRRYQFNY